MPPPESPYVSETRELARLLFTANRAATSRAGLHFSMNRDRARRAFPHADIPEAELRAAIAGEILDGKFPW